MSFNRSIGSKGVLVVIVMMMGVGKLYGQEIDIEKVQEQYRRGQYVESLENSRKSLEERRYNQGWRILYLKSLLAVGDYIDARSAIKETLQRYPVNLQYLSLAYEIYLSNGDVEKADDALKQIVRYGRTWGLEYWNSQEIVALGQALLRQGAEPRLVLESHFGATIKKDPDCLEAYLAAGHLALDKNDYELAGDYFQQGLKRFNDEQDLHYGLAQAFYHGDRETMIKSLDAALFVNSNHVPSLLLMAEHLIDAEDKEGAERYLERVLAVNKRQPEALAFRSLLAYLDNDPEVAKDYRAQALDSWRKNPKVDYLIGKKLSQNYRFAEGAAYQQLALSYDVNFQPAKMQLATDLLRLGYEEQGWQLVQGIYEQDAYNVEAYNLVNLSDHMAKFRTLETDDFIVRMAAAEADVFGDMVLELLAEAKEEVCGKYGIELTEPVIVEIFDNQQDFAVRTFGMPGGDGFLGVCFGPVIT
ncbi:MAG: tetratricopeptide repeat protein, partial [Planctomycetes bacterium]|nr:tetratricopeptide repeat protein [Planctomycetota bacterium]